MGQEKRLFINFLLVAKPIILLAIRAFPGNTVTRHSPKIFQHTILTNGEAASALPAKRSVTPTTVAINLFCPASFFPITGSI